MDAFIYHQHVLPAALTLFEDRFISVEAAAMLLAIGEHESKFTHRQQLVGGIRDWWRSERGPAAGYFQFERIGIRGVLEHRASAQLSRQALAVLGYPDDVETVFKAMIHNDILSAVMARLALWRIPERLPRRDEADEAYRQYLEVWRPGKRRDAEWGSSWWKAWEVLDYNSGILINQGH